MAQSTVRTYVVVAGLGQPAGHLLNDGLASGVGFTPT